MKRIATFCEKITPRRGKKKGAPGKTDYGGANTGLNMADIEQRQAEIEEALPEVERILCEREKESQLHTLSYTEFVYAVKRYTFRGQPFNERIFEGISADLNIDYKKIKEEKSNDLYYQSIKNKHLYHQGNYTLETWLAMGFLMCQHSSQQDQKDQFW